MTRWYNEFSLFQKTDSEKDEIYFKMKKMRDIECGKMKEASNALWTIRNSAGRTWTKELLAESILLETGKCSLQILKLIFLLTIVNLKVCISK